MPVLVTCGENDLAGPNVLDPINYNSASSSADLLLSVD
jgi:hypothetical protein